MELIRLRRRLALARRGHKLLQDKLEEMMRRFLMLLKDIDLGKEIFQKKTKRLIEDLLYSRITTPIKDFEESISNVDSKISVAVSERRIMNVKVPEFSIAEFSIEKNYSFFKTSGQMDTVVYGAKDYISSVLKLSQLLKSLDVLSYEIERTRRRVNALEYILVPSIEDTIRYINQKLNEFERSNLTRLMRVKEIVRAH